MQSMPTNYWHRRKHLRYYADALTFARKLAPHAATLLDVGTGPTMYLSAAEGYSDIAAVDIKFWPEWDTWPDHISKIISPFERLSPIESDVVLCLQTLEHISPDIRDAFVAKLFACAKQVLVVSIPYKWSNSKTPNHDGLDQSTLDEWMGRTASSCIVSTETTGHMRLISGYVCDNDH